jgi:hypothetical protein
VVLVTRALTLVTEEEQHLELVAAQQVQLVQQDL